MQEITNNLSRYQHLNKAAKLAAVFRYLVNRSPSVKIKQHYNNVYMPGKVCHQTVSERYNPRELTLWH
jgi:hypothetical protein